MKRKIYILTLVLVIIIMSLTCFAADANEINTADALNELGLFLGTGNGYELENGLTRAQGITLLVRMIGAEESAINNTYNQPFTDIPEWASGYIGYAYKNGITNGTGETTFSPDEDMTDYMFLTLVMRALGYSDNGENPLFVWNSPYALATELNLISTDKPSNEFTRADAITVFWNALNTKLNGSELTLAEQLIEQKIFTATEWEKAKEIRKNGRQNDEDKAKPKPKPKPIILPNGDDEPEVPTVPDSEHTQDPAPQPEPNPGEGEFPIG